MVCACAVCVWYVRVCVRCVCGMCMCGVCVCVHVFTLEHVDHKVYTEVREQYSKVPKLVLPFHYMGPRD